MTNATEAARGDAFREIAVLLPFAERFDPSCAGAIALCVRDMTRHSRYAGRTRIYGAPIARAFEGFDYVPVEPAGRWFRGRNRGLAEGFRRAVAGAPPDLVEIHNRPQVFFHLARTAPNLPLAFHFHNDPQEMAALRTAAARGALLERAAVVYCVSDYIRRRLLDGLDGDFPQARVLINGIERALDAPPVKEPLILFVGRLIDDKGAMEFAEAVARVLARRPGWKAAIVGARKPGLGQAADAFEQRVYERFTRIGPQAEFLGYRTHAEVMDLFARAAVAVVPSKWHDPCPRTALEALAAGCALVAGDRGGLPEIVGDRGLLVRDPTPDQLTEVLGRLMDDDGFREQVQRRAWQEFPFEIRLVSGRLDAMRDEALRPLARRPAA